MEVSCSSVYYMKYDAKKNVSIQKKLELTTPTPMKKNHSSFSSFSNSQTCLAAQFICLRPSKVLLPSELDCIEQHFSTTFLPCHGKRVCGGIATVV